MAEQETRPAKTVAVFCGSASGEGFDYHAEAFRMGQALAKAGHQVVYGGGRVGLMGAVADGCLKAKGHRPALCRVRLWSAKLLTKV